mmetsp:Transcript_35170/g.62453  ORF Transcript_35170/g.62453 Transcript_35170/m.62453 type:complete len:221 (+) Transcript_35170:230-892(+)
MQPVIGIASPRLTMFVPINHLGWISLVDGSTSPIKAKNHHHKPHWHHKRKESQKRLENTLSVSELIELGIKLILLSSSTHLLIFLPGSPGGGLLRETEWLPLTSGLSLLLASPVHPGDIDTRITRMRSATRRWNKLPIIFAAPVLVVQNLVRFTHLLKILISSRCLVDIWMQSFCKSQIRQANRVFGRRARNTEGLIQSTHGFYRILMAPASFQQANKVN